MDLILWRHAEAEDARPGQDDLERVLTERGRRQAQHVGEWLGQRLAPTARILVSPSRRTQQTARALGRHFETVEAIAPDRSVAELLRAADWPHGSGQVVVVGHQPTLGAAAARVLCAQDVSWSVRKGAAWWFTQKGGDHEGDVTLLSVQSPELI